MNFNIHVLKKQIVTDTMKRDSRRGKDMYAAEAVAGGHDGKDIDCRR